MPVAKRKAPVKRATKKLAAKRAATKVKRPTATPKAAKPPFGRAGTAGKAEGDAPVAAYIAALSPEHRAIAEAVDAIIAREIPGVKRAVKWSMPFYGVEGRGWFAAFASFTKHRAVRFFQGAVMEPVPPEGGGKQGRSVNYATLADLDEGQLADWVRQAARLPGWGS
ncbi:MAG TPA: DUF1801 domain-containing protein [Candidatus Thermoplasmatota archaeon]|nr:DUF1801 domain-containing protein [Candidatus Thermoplasmatota archaeon]